MIKIDHMVSHHTISLQKSFSKLKSLFLSLLQPRGSIDVSRESLSYFFTCQAWKLCKILVLLPVRGDPGVVKEHAVGDEHGGHPAGTRAGDVAAVEADVGPYRHLPALPPPRALQTHSHG